MSAVPAVRAPAGAGPLLDIARSLWPLASERWGVYGGVLEGVGAALAAAPAVGLEPTIWPEGESHPPPLVLAGFPSAELLARAIDERPDTLGYRPRVMIVEPQGEVALTALTRYAAMHDKAAAVSLLEAPGVEWFVGPEGMALLERWLVERVDDPLPGQVLAVGSPAGLPAGVTRVLSEAIARQQAMMRQRVDALRQWANNRPRRDTLEQRWRSGGELRILVCTTRYSTYMRHAAADLADALGAIGHEGRLLLEPDDHTRQTQPHYMRAVLEFDPDAVVLLNYLRPQIGPVLPPHIPVVTWSQDAMEHYFRGAQPPRAGPRDFVAGLLYPELRTRLGVPEERMLSWPNAVSPRKFHRKTVDGQFEHLRCDVALMTRHCETPSAYVRRRMHATGATTIMGQTLVALEPRVPAALERAAREHRWLARELRAECHAALRESTGRVPAEDTTESVLQQIAMPLADLHYRQQAARWAARVCERNGWRLHLYGKGWETHPELAAHARGELAHGEELRAAYQLAGVTIHASVRGQNHQRVAEAAMSGGLPIVRRCFEDADRARWYQLNAMVGNVEPDGQTKDGRPTFVVANHAGLMCVAALWGRCGLTLGEDGLVSPSPYEMGILRECPLGKPRLPHEDPAWPLIDVGEVGFTDEEGLERIVRRSMDPRWRSAWSAAIDTRARERFGMDHFAHAMVGLVRMSFA